MSARTRTAAPALSALVLAGVVAAGLVAAPAAHADDEPVRDAWFCTYTPAWKFIETRQVGLSSSDFDALKIPGSWYHEGGVIFVAGSKSTRPTFDRCTQLVKLTMTDDLPEGAWDGWDPRVGVAKKAPVPSVKPTPVPTRAPRGVPAKTGVEDDPTPLAPIVPVAAAGVLGLAALVRRRG